jgi:hypothetical protein
MIFKNKPTILAITQESSFGTILSQIEDMFSFDDADFAKCDYYASPWEVQWSYDFLLLKAPATLFDL